MRPQSSRGVSLTWPWFSLRTPASLWASREAWTDILPVLRRWMRALQTQYPAYAHTRNLLTAGEPYRNAAGTIAHAFIEDVYRDIQHQHEELEP